VPPRSPCAGFSFAVRPWSAEASRAAEQIPVAGGQVDGYLLDLTAGRNDRAIAPLREETGQCPLREPLCSQLIRALAGAGRPAEAIRQYHRTREILAGELRRARPGPGRRVRPRRESRGSCRPG
jgi:hypothetical protein